MNAKKIGAAIYYHRKISGLSRVACAEIAGVGKTVIFDIEHGKETVRLDSLQKVMKVLNMKFAITSPLMKDFEKEKMNES